MIIQHSMLTCIILQGSMTVTFGTKRRVVIPWISPRYYYAKNLCSNIFIVFLFNSSSAEQIDLLENVFALSKGANYKNDKTFVSTANNAYFYTSNLQSH